MKKTMKIDEEVHAKLMDLGKKGESFSDIILRLIKNKKK